MTAKVRLDIFQGVEATIDQYKWTSPDPEIAKILNNLLPVDGAEASDPNPDYTEAQKIIKRFGGEILSFKKSKFDPKVIY
jgi:hypothetical protein